MMLSSPVMPMRFHRDVSIPEHMTGRPRGRCRRAVRRGPPAFGPPAWLFAHAGGPHRHQGPFSLPPFIEDVFGTWKEAAGIPVNKDETRSKPDWKDSVNCDGFSPDEVRLDISGDKIFVHCSHEVNDGDGNMDVRQLKRTINVPEDVDSDRITATLNKKSVLEISAPRKTENKNKAKENAIPAETAEGINGNTDDADCSSNGCVDKGETTDSSVEEMDVQKADSTDMTEDRTAEQTTEAEKSVQPQNKPYQIQVDMKKFNPDSIEVKLSGNALTITGKQEDKDESTGKVLSSRTVYRRLFVPDHVNGDLLTSSLNSQGEMTISAPYKTEADSADKVIPISLN